MAIYGNVTRRSRVHGVVKRTKSTTFRGTGRYIARTACGKVATLHAGSMNSTVPVTGDEPDRVDCKACRTKLQKLRPDLFPASTTS